MKKLFLILICTLLVCIVNSSQVKADETKNESVAISWEVEKLNTFERGWDWITRGKKRENERIQAEQVKKEEQVKKNISAQETLNNNQTFDLSIVTIGEGSPKTFKELSKKIISFLSVMISSIAMLAIMAWGVMMMISSGDENLSWKGKTIIMASILSIVLVLSSYLIVTAVQQIFYALWK